MKDIIIYRVLSRLKVAAFVCLAAFAAMACTRDAQDDDQFTSTTETTAMVTFSINLPLQEPPSTRALDALEEAEVKEIDILVFYTSSGFYKYKVSTDQIETDLVNPNKKTFTVPLPTGQNFDLIIFANSREQLQATTISETTRRSDLQQSLVYEHNGKWITDTSDSNYKGIPMWGERTINVSQVNATVNNVQLHRLLARIDVSCLSSWLKLKEIHLYNTTHKGIMIPNDQAWYLGQAIDSSWPVAWAKSSGPIVYTEITDNKCQNVIYTFEAPAGEPDDPKNTFIIVAGLYGTDTELSYYKIELVTDENGTLTYIPLIRNHSYSIYITSVAGRGAPSLGEAVASTAYNIEAKILVENDFDLSYFMYDHNYYLGVETDYFDIPWYLGDDIPFTVKTNYPDGWTAKYSSSRTDPDYIRSGSEWLTPKWGNGEGPGKTYLTFDAQPNLNPYDRGTGYWFIHIYAGPFHAVVELFQGGGANAFEVYIDQWKGDIPAAGQERLVYADGTFPDLNLRVYDTTNDELLLTGFMEGRTGGYNTAAFDIPYYWDDADIANGDRQIAFEYELAITPNPMPGWHEATNSPKRQLSYFAIPSTNYSSGTVIPGEGAQYTVRVQRSCPMDILVRAYSPDTNTEVSRERLSFSAYTNGSTINPTLSIEILPNTKIPIGQRQVEFQYSKDNGVTWITFDNGPQEKGHYRLKTSGRIVALYNMPGEITWAEAMGLDDTRPHGLESWGYTNSTQLGGWSQSFGHGYNARLFVKDWNGGEIPSPMSRYAVYHNYGYSWDPDNTSFYYDFNFPGSTDYPYPGHVYGPWSARTGCPEYEEEGYETVYPKGGWRVPSRDEMIEIYQIQDLIGDVPVKDIDYWTSTELGTMMSQMRAIKMNFTDGYDDSKRKEETTFYKNTYGRVRCVYGEPYQSLIDKAVVSEPWD